MNKLVLQLTDTYALHLNLVDCDSPAGYKSLSIDSVWSGAKDPNALQKRFHVVLSEENWNKVAAYILDTSCPLTTERTR